MVIASTIHPEQFVLELDGNRYHVATAGQAAEVGGGARSWHSKLVSDQNAKPQPFTEPLGDFSGGWGHMWYDAPNVYDLADGWDTSVPGAGAATWHRLGVTADQTGNANLPQFFFQMKHPTDTSITYLYHIVGRYVYKYPVDGSGVGAILEKHDLGSSNFCLGQPAVFNGRAYVARATANAWSPTLTTWEELTTVATTVVEVQTIAISGSPTSGTYTVTYAGNTTAGIAWDAVQATVQAALRTLAGLEQVTVVTTGSSPNYTHTVTMTGVPLATGTSSPPEMTSSAAGLAGGAPAIAHATTVAGVGDTWTVGSANRQARGFIVWDKPEGSVLVLFNANNIRTAAAISTPPVDGDWSDTTAAGDSSYGITALATYKPNLLVVGRQDGWGTFDETVTFHFEKLLPPDQWNCFGMLEHDGFVYIPTRLGRYEWAPGDYNRVGPEWTRDLDLNVASGNRSSGFASVGETLFEVINMVAPAGTAEYALIGYHVENGRLVPHMHHRIADSVAGAHHPLCGVHIVNTQDSENSIVVVGTPNDTNTNISSFTFLFDGARPALHNGMGSADTLAKTLRTSFYPLGSLAVQKTVRGLRHHLEVHSSADIADMSVWFRFLPSLVFPSSAESWTQCLNSAGSAASFDDAGVVEVWLPQTSAGVGRAIQFEFRVASGGTAAWYRIKDAEMFGSLDPEMTQEIQTVLVLGEGQFEDGSWQQIDAGTQRTRLEALAELTTAAVSYRDPMTRSTGRIKVTSAEFREVKFTDLGPRYVAILGLRQQEYA